MTHWLLFLKNTALNTNLSPPKGYEDLTDIKAIGRPLPHAIYKNLNLIIKQTCAKNN